MKLTERCMALLRLLRAARWLTTSQVHRRFFAGATRDAARKRLRRLAGAGYVAVFREHRMAEALFSLGREGKRVLERNGMNEIALERRPPKQLEHFVGINDLRIAAELTGELSYFFACWELPNVGWRYRVIPDAVFSIRNRTFALEFDRGREGIRYLVRTKMTRYFKGFDGFPVAAVILVTDRKTRMEALAKAIGDGRNRVLFTTVDLVRERGILAPVFQKHGVSQGVALV